MQFAAAFAAAALALQAPPAPSAPAPVPEPVSLGLVEGWELFDNHGNCAVITTYESGAMVRVSYDWGENEAWLSVFDRNWRSIEDGAEYRISLIFTNGSDYGPATAHGRNSMANGFHLLGIASKFKADDFLHDFAESGAFGVMMGETRLGAFDLTGTRAAVARLRACAVRSHRRNPPDPFRNVAPTRRPGTSPTRI